MKGMLALVLDRATAATVSRINYEIGHDVQLHPFRYKGGIRYRRENDYSRALTEFSSHQRRVNVDGQSDYEALLREYVETKLYLHSMRKSMYYPYDAYAEREGDFTAVLDRCREIRAKIKELRGNFTAAAWGEFAPEPAPNANDKPLLYAMDDHQCSYFTEWNSDEDAWIQCQLAGEHWFRGLPYCRSHLGQARKDVKYQRRYKQAEARAKHRTAYLTGDYSVNTPQVDGEPCTYIQSGHTVPCGRKYPHGHYGGRIERF
jgi:hypothetical protein